MTNLTITNVVDPISRTWPRGAHSVARETDQWTGASFPLQPGSWTRAGSWWTSPSSRLSDATMKLQRRRRTWNLVLRHQDWLVSSGRYRETQSPFRRYLECSGVMRTYMKCLGFRLRSKEKTFIRSLL